MSASENGLSDEFHGELNPPEDTNEPPANPLPKRPGKTAPVDAWVDYAVSLGADRTFLTEETKHAAWELQEGRPVEVTVTEPALTRAELIDLADRLGG